MCLLLVVQCSDLEFSARMGLLCRKRVSVLQLTNNCEYAKLEKEIKTPKEKAYIAMGPFRQWQRSQTHLERTIVRMEYHRERSPYHQCTSFAFFLVSKKINCLFS